MTPVIWTLGYGRDGAVLDAANRLAAQLGAADGQVRRVVVVLFSGVTEIEEIGSTAFDEIVEVRAVNGRFQKGPSGIEARVEALEILTDQVLTPEVIMARHSEDSEAVLRRLGKRIPLSLSFECTVPDGTDEPATSVMTGGNQFFFRDLPEGQPVAMTLTVDGSPAPTAHTIGDPLKKTYEVEISRAWNHADEASK